MVTVLRPLSTSELLDRTFYLYRNNFPLFVGITAIPQLLVLALHLSAAVMAIGGQLIGLGVITLVSLFANYVAIQVSHSATVVAVSNVHLDQPVSIGSAYRTARPAMLRVIGISLVIIIAAFLGFLLLVIPGIYLLLMWSLAIPVTVLEGGGLNVSTARSRQLTNGSRGRIFIIYLLIVVLAIVISVVIEWPLGILAALLGYRQTGNLMAVVEAVQAAGNFISTCLIGPLATIALTLIYYDQRVRKEGFDLELMMARLQPQAATAARNA